MQRTLLMTFILCFWAFDALRAQDRYEDVMYLTNGSILRGKMLENFPGKFSSIEITGHNTIVIQDKDIQRILLHEKIPVKFRESPGSPVEVISSVCFYGGTNNSAGFNVGASYRFPFRLSVGTGIGVEWFTNQQLPFSIDLHYSILKTAFTPFLFGKCGWSVVMSKQNTDNNTYNNVEYYGGPLASVGIGLRYNLSNRNALVFSTGYRYQKTKTVTNYFYWGASGTENIRIDEYNRIFFSLGFLFN